eukprot:Protomagalhaensia_sp_Gyna_25__563@NODE_1265_length_2001_cov_100_598369_g1007_i0_p1_GENE_NODE_1265_length_2001_cov_100_598369_g1007_i0NODE_1265_length_2001_cov_100_598369_g1007_i0_p1_ORF_typecomplete_len573_score85_07ATPsulfurylase/PF01747_17/7_3e78APS_kinase/PF01583_20/3_9e57PUA_2/PF14306_6/3_3e31AAA_33/PF13671_6/9_4e10KTI12/PF08433_10/0_00017AAA_18/PF13238_6/3_3e03AAA_18/PF13238_6/0_0026Zeta_toxin/PF06414_12/0_0019AAA_28/PF13521_6/0_029AAA_31/PF13614_6/0_023ParA/PF10609_9/0_036AAA_16/PF13191_6/
MSVAISEIPVLQEVSHLVELPRDWALDERAICDLELLLCGAMAPLSGYMNLSDYLGCLHRMRLATNGAVWTIPIVLPIPLGAVTGNATPDKNRTIKLRDFTNALVAEVKIESVFRPDLELEKEKVLGLDNANHPYAKHLNEKHQCCLYVGGSLTRIHPIAHFDYKQYRLTPADVKTRLQERGWNQVVGFQTRNPMHRSHFELTLQALRDVAASSGEPAHLMLSPAIGPTQPGDVDFRVRVRCYERILEHYKEQPLLVLLPIAMRMAGPREAVWHAIIRKNFGCTHFVVGRDHAGPSCTRADGSRFYGQYEAQALLSRFAPEIGINPVFAKNMVYCGPELGFCQEDQVPAGASTAMLSGTAFRRLLITRQPVPAWFCFEDVVSELHDAYQPLHQRGLCVYFTGLPCAGKSTLACALEAVLLECRLEKRRVTVLDADIIRTHLSKGLGFSRTDRSLNVRRIGYVASEIVKHGGVCLVANIAPYADDRDYNRTLIEAAGGTYIEVFVSTPLSICESRDVKELYKKARMGVIKQFTGISDPYEKPISPDIMVDSSEDINGKVTAVLNHLKTRGLVL